MHLPHLELPDEVIAAFCRRWRIAELSFFGSVLRHDFEPHSDVDLLVSFEEGADWSLFDLVTMREELASILGRPVDLVEQAALRNPYRRAAIVNSKQVVYAV